MTWVDRRSVRCGRPAAIAAVAVCMVLPVTSAPPAGGQPTAAPAEAPVASGEATSARDDVAVSRKHKNDVGIKGHGFVADDGVFTTIDAPDAGLYTVVFGLDDTGRTVGGYVDTKGRLHGFLRDPDGTFTTIDVPGATGTSITGLNDGGRIIGLYLDADGIPHAFLLNQGVVTTIDAPGATFTFPTGINNRGQIVGFYDDGERGRGFMWENGALTTPAVPPGTFGTAFPLDIDDRGRIFGVYF